MPAKVQFGGLTLNAAAYLIHVHADPAGTHPKIADLGVYVLAHQPNNIDRPLANPTQLMNPGTLTLFWAGDNNPTHEFQHIHLQATLAAVRTQHSRTVLLKFGYGYNPQGVPGWAEGGVKIVLHYPKAHDNAANYLNPVLPHPQGADHRLAVTGAEVQHGAGPTWQVAPGNRRLLAFEYATGSGITAAAQVPPAERLAMISYRDNKCRILNTLLEQDRQIRAGHQAEPAAKLELTMPGQTNAIPIPLANVGATRLVYVEHRNFWPQPIVGGEPWSACSLRRKRSSAWLRSLNSARSARWCDWAPRPSAHRARPIRRPMSVWKPWP